MSCRCHYKGRLASNNAIFDSSYERGRPLSFKIGVRQVIAGERHVRMMHEPNRDLFYALYLCRASCLSAPSTAVPICVPALRCGRGILRCTEPRVGNDM